MAWLKRALSIPASESKMAVVLALSAVAMSLLSAALVWQAQIIASQRESIRYLAQLKFGG